MRILAVLLVCPFMGCAGIAYPVIPQTPTITVDEPDTKAFRVNGWLGSADCNLTGGHIEVPDSVDELPIENGVIS